MAKTIRVHIVLLAVLAALVMFVACSPPGAKTEGQGGGSGGKKAQQDIAQASGNVCKVKPPNLKLEDAVVGFSQSEKEVNPFRIAETESIRSEAKKRNIKELVYTNANSQASKQISDIRDMIAQDVDAIIVAPLLEEGMDPALNAAKEAGIPVFLIDRETAGTPCEDYITFMGSDFLEQGKRAADIMAGLTNEKGTGRRARGDTWGLGHDRPHRRLRETAQEVPEHGDRCLPDRGIPQDQGPDGHGTAHTVQPRH